MKSIFTKFAIGIMTGVMVFGSVAVSAAVTKEDARKTALEAAGLKAEDVIFKQEKEDMDDGRKIFEVDFFVPGEKKYEFDIDENTGKIIDQDMDLWEPEDDYEYATLIEAAKEKENSIAEAVKGEVGEQQAKEIATKDVGVNVKDVAFTKCQRDFDDGLEIFEVEFRTADGTEYAYDIRVGDGRILSKDVDRFEFDD